MTPDYGYWSKRDLWQVNEAIELIVGLDPSRNKERDYRHNYSSTYRQIAGIAETALEAGNLKPYEIWENQKAWEYRRVKPSVFLKWAKSKELCIPDELLSLLDVAEPEQPAPLEKNVAGKPEMNARASQLAKAACQAVAKTLWKANPDMSIADMLKREEILEYGGGKHYSPEKTVRSWLSEVDPRPRAKKTGRPKGS